MVNLNRAFLEIGAIGKSQVELQKLDKATKDIEALFFKDLMSAMRQGMPQTSFGDNYGGEMFKDLFDQSVSSALSQTGSLGIGKVIFRSLAPNVVAQVRTRLVLDSQAPTEVPAKKPDLDQKI